MKVIINKDRKQVLANFNGHKAPYTKGIFLKMTFMDKVGINGQMVVNIKAAGRKIKSMDKVR